MNKSSLLGKEWIFKKFDNNEVNFIKENFSLNEILSKIISSKKLNREDLSNYINPIIKNLLPNPQVLRDMTKGIERTYQAIISNEKIGIFGDYDVDGATSTAFLSRYFKSIKQENEIYIPDRSTEGYGPSKKGFDKLLKDNSKLIFTLDCGTLAFEPIDYLTKKKIDVIVLDHHQSEINLPNAHSIINPNRLDDDSNLNYLCAAGVTFMFLVGLNKKLRNENWFKNNNLTEPNLLNYLDLVSLGTICDVVPLIGLNRAFVKQGIKILKKKKNIGLKTLIDLCKLDNNLNTYHIGYIIGPRINAGGRVGKCTHGAKLLIEEDPKSVFTIANELNTFNYERQNIEKDLLNIVLNKINNPEKNPIIILVGEKWHEGVIGIIASRIKDKYNKPAIIISFENNVGKASARSVTGFDIGSLIISAVQENLLIKGGGHKMAGGFSIKRENVNKFISFANRKITTLNKIYLQKKILMIDAEIAPSALNYDFFSKIEILSPFGSGNPEPKFLIKNLKVVKTKTIKDSHISCNLLSDSGEMIKCFSFNSFSTNIGGFLLKKNTNKIDIVGKLSLNEWKGKKNVEFIIDDISVNKNH